MKRDGSMPDDLAEVFAAVLIAVGVIIAIVSALYAMSKCVYGE